jgi:hypothetical protein
MFFVGGVPVAGTRLRVVTNVLKTKVSYIIFYCTVFMADT